MTLLAFKKREKRDISLDAFLASVERRAYRTALLSTHNPDDALDIVQEAMLKLVKGYSDHEPATWPLLFHRILQHAIIDWHRQHQRQDKYFWQLDADKESDAESNDTMDQYVDQAMRSPAENLSNSQDMTMLLSALETLPVRQRQAFLLRLWEGFDTAETASIMECSEGSVKTHYFRALQTLKAALTPNTDLPQSV